MRQPSLEEQRRIVKQWSETGARLEALRRENLSELQYNHEDMDALLELGDHVDLPPRTTTGLVEWQRWVRLWHERKQTG